jgi:hypothetical protein
MDKTQQASITKTDANRKEGKVDYRREGGETSTETGGARLV